MSLDEVKEVGGGKVVEGFEREKYDFKINACLMGS